MDHRLMISGDASKTRNELIAELRQLRREVECLQRAAEREISQVAGEEDGDICRYILGNVPLVAFALDREGKVTFSEGQGLRSVGLKSGEMIGKSVLDEFGDRIADLEQHFFRVLNEEGPGCTTVELAGVIFEVWHSPLRDPKGNVVGVAGMAIDVTQRERAERKLRQGQRLMKQMLLRHERDRKLLAYEIHDGLVQDAVAAQLQLETLLQTDELPSGRARDQIRLTVELVRNAISESRQLIGGLRPPALDRLGVVPAIEYLIGDRETEGLAVGFSADVQFDRLESLLEATIYRIVQEAITNVKRHSGSDRVEIRLTQVDDRIHLEIRDWGVGFDPAAIAESRFGLQGIRERARLLQGRATIDSAPQKGTRILVDLPLVHALEQIAGSNTGVPNE